MTESSTPLMHGLRLKQNCFCGPIRSGIRQIVDVLREEMSQLYCASVGDFLEYDALPDSEMRTLDGLYEGFLLQKIGGFEGDGLNLFDRGFLVRFRDYLYGDWTDFYLLTERIPLDTFRPGTNWVPDKCAIFVRCIDAGLWEVFATERSVLNRIQQQFPEAERCNLAESVY
jgi:hypothetical protein